MDWLQLPTVDAFKLRNPKPGHVPVLRDGRIREIPLAAIRDALKASMPHIMRVMAKRLGATTAAEITDIRLIASDDLRQIRVEMDANGRTEAGSFPIDICATG